MPSMNDDVERNPLLPVNESEPVNDSTGWKTKLSAVALVLAATAGVSYYSAPASGETTSLNVQSSEKKLTATTQTHVVFMLVDDMGNNDIGYLSSDLSALTPNLDTLAKSGIILDKYYSMQLCTPARSAFLTAKYPMRLGMQYENIHPDMPWGLPLEEKLVSHYFRESGYKSYMVGKWNQGHYKTSYHPTSRGFDSFVGYLSDEINYYTHEYPQAFDDMSFSDFQEGTEVDGISPLSLSGTYSTEVYTQRILSLVSSHDTETGEYADMPMFLYYAAQNVHGPMDAPPLSVLEESAIEEIAKLNLIDGEHRQVFAAIVSAFDTSIGTIKSAMEDAGIWENSLIVMASDNGGCGEEGGSNSPLRGGKHWLFEGGVKVPAFLYSASSSIIPTSKQGTIYSQYVHVTDWVPTLLSAIDAPSSALPTSSDDIDGVDHYAMMIADTDDQTAVRDDILLHLTSYTTCCTGHDGAETCSGFLSDCEDTTEAVLSTMDTPRGALISSDGYKLIVNEYTIPWYGIPTASAAGASRKLLSDDDSSPDIVDSKDSSGNPMSNCGNNPGTTMKSWLFDLNSDPYETTDLWGTLPDVQKKMMNRFKAYVEKEVEANWVNEDTSAYASWTENGNFIGAWM